MNHLFSTQASHPDAAYLAKRIKVIKKIIENSIFALGLNFPQSQATSQHKSSSNGFKVHSSKSLKSEDKNKIIDTLSESENFFKLAKQGKSSNPVETSG